MTAESFAHFCCNFWHQAGPAPFNSCVCSRTRCCALCFVDDDGGALFFGRLFYFRFLHQYSSRHRKRIRRLRAPSLLDSSALVRLLLLPATLQAGRACSASCVLFSYLCKNRFDLMTAESFAHFCWILCTRPALHLLFLTLETTRTRARLEHKGQDSTSPALLRLQQQEWKVHDAAVFYQRLARQHAVCVCISKRQRGLSLTRTTPSSSTEI